MKGETGEGKNRLLCPDPSFADREVAGGHPRQTHAREPGHLQRHAEKGVQQVSADDADKGVAEDRGRTARTARSAGWEDRNARKGAGR